jgi:hypothetical protein
MLSEYYALSLSIHVVSLSSGIWGLLLFLQCRQGLLFRNVLVVSLVNIITQSMHIGSIFIQDPDPKFIVGRVAYTMTAILCLAIMYGDCAILECFRFLSPKITTRYIQVVRMFFTVLAILAGGLYIAKSLTGAGASSLAVVSDAINTVYAFLAVLYDTSQTTFLGFKIHSSSKSKMSKSTKSMGKSMLSMRLLICYGIHFILEWFTIVVYIIYAFQKEKDRLYGRMPTMVMGVQTFLQCVILIELKSMVQKPSRLRIKKQTARRCEAISEETKKDPNVQDKTTILALGTRNL